MKKIISKINEILPKIREISTTYVYEGNNLNDIMDDVNYLISELKGYVEELESIYEELEELEIDEDE